jgi:hypothetical protein
LVNRSDRYDAAVTGRLAAYLKRLKHAIPPDDRFSGDDPIEIMGFLRTFKDSADHNEVGEGAAARLIPYFLTGTSKESYRAQLDEVPPGMPAYPYLIQYLLETYAFDDELSKAYMAVSTTKRRVKVNAPSANASIVSLSKPGMSSRSETSNHLRGRSPSVCAVGLAHAPHAIYVV